MNNQGLRGTLTMLDRAAAITRDKLAVDAGERLTYTRMSSSVACTHCHEYSWNHIRQNGFLFCPENTLRERWGK